MIAMLTDTAGVFWPSWQTVLKPIKRWVGADLAGARTLARVCASGKSNSFNSEIAMLRGRLRCKGNPEFRRVESLAAGLTLGGTWLLR